jgi:hypothetical protein
MENGAFEVPIDLVDGTLMGLKMSVIMSHFRVHGVLEVEMSSVRIRKRKFVCLHNPGAPTHQNIIRPRFTRHESQITRRSFNGKNQVSWENKPS